MYILYFSVVAWRSCFFGFTCGLLVCIVEDRLSLLEKVLSLLSLNLFDVALLIVADNLINAFWTCQCDLGTILHLKFL